MPAVAPVRFARVWLAGALDQLALFGFLTSCFVMAGELDGLQVAAIVTGIFGTVVLAFIEAWVLARQGTTVGLFLMGCRVAPWDPMDYEDALIWFVEFWKWTLLGPLLWALGRVLAVLDRILGTTHEESDGIVRDPRCTGTGARCARVLLGALLVLSWLPLVIRIAA